MIFSKKVGSQEQGSRAGLQLVPWSTSGSGILANIILNLLENV